MYLTKHFTLPEMVRSATAKKEGIDNWPCREYQFNLKALCEKVLEPLRLAVGVPLKVSSGYRCKELNSKIGGVPSSQHTLGEAVDIVCDAVSHETIYRKAIELKLPFDQIILENADGRKWIHISHRRGCVVNRRECLTYDGTGYAVYAPETRKTKFA